MQPARLIDSILHGRIVTGVPRDTTLKISSTSAFSRAMHPSVQFVPRQWLGLIALSSILPWMPIAPPSRVSQGGCCRSSLAFLIRSILRGDDQPFAAARTRRAAGSG